MDRHVSFLFAIIAVITGLAAFSCIHQASPNEWLLVVNDNGEQIKATVGGTHIALPWEQVVRFPSSLQRVSFRAQQVTREMQGIEVRGFASWVVYREGTGPLNAYRHLNGLTPAGIEGANDSLRDMAESIIRAKLANLTIAQVITSREHLRDTCQKSMMEVVKGWGVWIETLEVTEVTILSKTLFSNMQTQFREETRLNAGLLELETDRTLSERKLKLGLSQSEQEMQIRTHKLQFEATSERQTLELEAETAKLKAELSRKRVLFQAEQDLLLSQQKSALEQQQHELALLSIQRAHEKRVLEQAHQLQLNSTLEHHDRTERQEYHKLTLQQFTDQLRAEKTMDHSNHRNAELRAKTEIFSKMPIRDVKLVNFGGMTGNASGSGEMGLLPGLWAGVNS